MSSKEENQRNYEDRMRDQREREATKKNFMGLEGKFGCILKNMGSPILAQGSSMFEVSYMDDPYELPDDEDAMPTADEDESVYKIGMIFDGLRYGTHIEIKYKSDESELLVSYKGYPVYREITGELDSYIPNDEWERKIEDLYDIAKQMDKKRREKMGKTKEEETTKERMSFLQKIIKRWGKT
jgi:hypothetical protein